MSHFGADQLVKQVSFRVVDAACYGERKLSILWVFRIDEVLAEHSLELLLKLAIDHQTRIQVYLSIKAHGPGALQNKIVRLQSDIIDVDPLVFDSRVDASITKFEQLKLVDLEKLAELDQKLDRLELRRDELEVPDSVEGGAITRVTVYVERALKNALRSFLVRPVHPQRAFSRAPPRAVGPG